MASPKKPVLTARETELAGLVWQCFEVEPKVRQQYTHHLLVLSITRSVSIC